MGALYEGDLVLKKPDYQAAVLNVVNLKAPFMLLLPEGPTVKQMIGQWPVVGYGTHEDPTAAEGVDKTSGFGSYVPDLLTGVAQIFASAGWKVTDLASLIDSWQSARAGLGFQQAKDAENLVLSMEKLLLASRECQVASGAAKYQTRAVWNWLLNTAQAVYPVPEALRPTSAQRFTGTLAAYTESAFKAQVKAAFEQVDQDVDLVGFVGIALKTQMSSFGDKIPVTASTEAVRRQLASKITDERVKSKVDFFEYDGGSVKTIAMPRLLCDLAAGGAKTDYTTRSGVFLDMDKWNMQWLQRMKPLPLTDEGGGPRGYHKAIGRLCCKTPQGQFSAYISADS